MLLVGVVLAIVGSGMADAGFAADADATADAVLPEAQALEPLYAAPTRLDRSGRVLAAVEVNGQGPFRFILDTGANSSGVAPRLVAALGLPVAEKSEIGVHGVTGSAMLPAVHVASLRAGDIELQGRTLPVFTQQVLAGADGILGVEGLQAARIEVDFTSDRVAIQRSSGRRAPKGFLTVPVRLEKAGLIMLKGRVGSVQVRIIIDTGAERTLGNAPLRDAIQHRVSRHDRSETTVSGVTADVRTGTSFLVPTITIGGAHLRNLPVTFNDLHVFDVWGLADEPALLIGMDLLGTLQQFALDYPRREFQFKPQPIQKAQGVRRCGPNDCRSRIPPSGT